MALQTHTSSSESPSSTAQPANPDNGLHNNAFSPAGSPPLILAFLAIGLFSAAMIVVFGWRRVQFGRFSIRPQAVGAFEPSNSAIAHLERPKLWEVWGADEVTWNEVSGCINQKGAGRHSGEWMQMMPLSVSINHLGQCEAQDLTSTGSISGPPSLHANLLNPHRQFLHTIWPQPWRRTNTVPIAKINHQSQVSPPALATSKSLQVGVAILLPSVQYPIYVKDRTDNGYPDEKILLRKRKELPDYSIGLYDCNWN